MGYVWDAVQRSPAFCQLHRMCLGPLQVRVTREFSQLVAVQLHEQVRCGHRGADSANISRFLWKPPKKSGKRCYRRPSGRCLVSCWELGCLIWMPHIQVQDHCRPLSQVCRKTKGLCRVCVGFPWGFGRPHNVPIRSLQEDTISHCKTFHGISRAKGCTPIPYVTCYPGQVWHGGASTPLSIGTRWCHLVFFVAV